MRRGYTPFIDIDSKTFNIWKEGIGELNSILDRVFPLEEVDDLLQIYPYTTHKYWYAYFNRSEPKYKELPKAYWDMVRNLFNSLLENVEEDSRHKSADFPVNEPHVNLLLVINRALQVVNNKENLSCASFTCFQQSMHLLGQYVDLSFPRPESNFSAPQRLYLSACKRVGQSADYLFYSILRCLELASMGAESVLSYMPALMYHPFNHVIWGPNSPKAKAYIDELIDGVKYADLAYAVPAKAIDHASGSRADIYLKPLDVSFYRESGKDIRGSFHYPCNLNGYVAYTDDVNPRILVGFSGTENICNWITNARQFLFGPDVAYKLASELLHKVVAKRNAEHKDWPVHVYGHSLGGGLMQYAMCNCHSKNVRGFGYNSAGLSIMTFNRCSNIRYNDIIHLYQPHDVVFLLPFTYQVGTAFPLDKEFHGISNTHGLNVIRANTGPKGQEVAEIL